jgi:hypothetical protein
VKLIYFSPVPWDSFTQRPHEFVSHFVKRTNGRVIWIEPYPTRMFNINDLFRLLNSESKLYRERPSWIEIIKPRMVPIEPLRWLNLINRLQINRAISIVKSTCECSKKGVLTIGKPSLLACEVLSKIKVEETLYDAMDDFPSFYSGISHRHMNKLEGLVSRSVKHLIVSSTNLEKKFLNRGLSPRLVLNACALGEIERIKNRENNLHGNKNIIGYVGTVAEWFDWDFVVELARVATNYEIRIIGSLLSPPPKELPANISVRPAVKHELAIREMLNFEIAMIPFKCNSLTHFVDPIKYYEYSALGIPIISTDFGEMSYRCRYSNVVITNKDSLSRLKIPIEGSEEIVTASWCERFDPVLDSISGE